MKNILIFVILAIFVTTTAWAGKKYVGPPVIRIVGTPGQVLLAKKDPTLTKVVLDTNLAAFPEAPARELQTWSTNRISWVKDGTNRFRQVISVSSKEGVVVHDAPQNFWAKTQVEERPKDAAWSPVTEIRKQTHYGTRTYIYPGTSCYTSYGFYSPVYSGGYGYTEKVRTHGNWVGETGSFSGMVMWPGSYYGGASAYVVRPGDTFGERVGPYYGPADVTIQQDKVYTLSAGVGGGTIR